MNQLDLFNELCILVNIIVSVYCTVLPKNKIQRIFWQVSQTCFKWRSHNRIMFGSIIRMFHITQMCIPKLRIFFVIFPKQMHYFFVHHLCMLVHLWMKCCPLLQYRVHKFPQDWSKFPHEPGVSTRYNRSR
jgi:hypothetical protein